MVPQWRIGLAALTKLAYQGGDLNPLRLDLVTRIFKGGLSAGALMDLSVIEQLHGNLEAGLDWQSKAFESCRMFVTCQGKAARKRVLVFAAPIHMGGNAPVDFLLQGEAFEIVTYYPGADSSPSAMPVLPPHDIAFCAAPADAEDAEVFFQNVRRISAQTGIHVLNLPEKLVKPERDTLPVLFEQTAGLRLPKTVRVERGALVDNLYTGEDTALLDGIGYPYVVRPVGSHAGLGLAKIESPGEMFAYLEQRPEPEFFVGEFIEYASDKDGSFRKYRIVLVDGKAYPCHMAISDQWDVWYMNANMTESEAKRLEEAEFMDTFDSTFNKRHRAAFTALAEGIGLDYFGIDCAEDADGNLVVFEADNALIVHDMDCETTFPYKKRHMHRIFSAFEAMLETHSSTDLSGASEDPEVGQVADQLDQHAMA